MNKSEGHGRTMASAPIARQWQPDATATKRTTYARVATN
ncbi:hypothetical protein EKH55_0993 [Sinorhizobium alkalisoli]|nr:hypothetical protein EKH55_0993 [Sinorhizobium alkalisoli]